MLAAQSSPAPQRIPQPPQSVALVVVSVQASPQSVPPSMHTQAPFPQLLPGPQTLPQLPQSVLLLVVSTHTVPQSESPLGQEAVPVPPPIALGLAPVPTAPLPPVAFMPAAPPLAAPSPLPTVPPLELLQAATVRKPNSEQKDSNLYE